MADPEHVKIVKQGTEAIRKWRAENPDVRLDLSEASLRNAMLLKADLHEADLSGAMLSKANLHWANLRKADLSEAMLFEADLSGASLGGANLVGANIFEADLHRALLDGADLRGAILMDADLGGAELIEASLGGANLAGANLHGADLGRANLTGAYLAEVRGAEHAYRLETVQFIPGEGIEAFGVPLGSDNDARDFESCERLWSERLFAWEHLRVVGRLPLFGVSYTVLILIPLVFYGLALYNDKIDLVRAWAEQVIALPDHPWHRVAPLVLDRLHPRPIPSLSLVLLVSTILLAIASTLYTLRCPSRIKEFSRDQWCDQLGRSLLHYWPLAWKHRYLRLICTACYALGGAGALWVLGNKVWHTALFIVQHSAWPWWWR